MKEIVKLTAQNLRTGRTRSQFADGGIWESAQGLNPYIENEDYRGLIACTASPTDITTLGTATLADIPIAYTKQEGGSTYELYMLGDGGHFYTINPTFTNMSDVRSGTQINAPVAGMGIIQPRGGSATLLFARQGRIGKWDMAGTYPTGWDDGAYDPGTTSVHRPFHRLFDRLYYGNANYVGQFGDDGSSGISHEAQALDLDGSDTVTALGDDGRYLIIGTARIVDDAYGPYNLTRVLFWDTSADSWDWETTIPNETSIRAIVRTESGVLLIGKYGVYTVSFGQHAKRVIPIDPDESVSFDAVNYGSPYSASPWGDGAIFGKLATAYSKYLPGEQRILFNPLQGFTGDIGLIIPDFLENKVIVGTRTPKLYSFDMTAAGNGGSGTSFVTRYIDLEGQFHLQALEIILPKGILGDMTINVQGTDVSNTVQLLVTAAKYPGKRIVRIPFNKNITTPHARISILMTSGSPAFSDISLLGEVASI